MSTTSSAGSSETQQFHRGLGLLDATMIVVGSMIGSGIFIAPSLMAGYLDAPGLIILLWLIGGVLTVFGGLSYGELAAAIPRAGGQYVFLREAYGPIWGFLYGWTLFLVIQTGFIAAVGVAFAKYLGVFLPSLSEGNVLLSVGSYSVNSAQVVAIISIIVLTVVNFFGVRLGALVQNIFTLSKLGALALLILFSFAIGEGSFSNFSPVFSTSVPEALQMTFFAAFAVAMSKALFAYDAWNSVTFTAEETKEPHKVLPRALVYGTGITAVVYTLTTMAYLYIVPGPESAAVADNRIAAEVAQRVMGSAGLAFVTVAILISTFGCNNGLILSGPRVYYAMAKDKLFFEKVANVHSVYRTPVISLIFQCVWSCVLTLTGTYSDLLTYTTFASLLFNVLTVVALFVFRKKRPDMERPYKVWGYPFVPIVYILVAVFFIVYIFVGDLRNSGLGLAIILTGVPVYFYWSRKTKS
ncbi:MAG: amino acid permease [Ignavibacteriales bacterium]|nr:amino acid permease [Ignavibacteriales bacterium]